MPSWPLGRDGGLHEGRRLDPAAGAVRIPSVPRLAHGPRLRPVRIAPTASRMLRGRVFTFERRIPVTWTARIHDPRLVHSERWPRQSWRPWD